MKRWCTIAFVCWLSIVASPEADALNETDRTVQMSLDSLIESALSYSPAVAQAQRDVDIAAQERAITDLNYKTEFSVITRAEYRSDRENDRFGSTDNEGERIRTTLSARLPWWHRDNELRERKRALIDETSAADNQNVTRLSIQYETCLAYYRVLLEKQLVRINQQALASAELRNQQINKEVSLGRVSQSEVFTERSNYKERAYDLSLSELDLSQALFDLSNLTGISDEELRTSIRGELNLDAPWLGENSDQEVPYFDDIHRSFDRSLESQEIDIEDAEDNIQPSLELQAYGIYGNDDESDNLGWGAGLVLRFPIPSGREKISKTLLARTRYTDLKLEKNETIFSAKEVFRQTQKRLSKLDELIDNSKEVVETKNENYQLALRDFELGRITRTQLIDFEQDAIAFRRTFNERLYDYVSTKVELLQMQERPILEWKKLAMRVDSKRN